MSGTPSRRIALANLLGVGLSLGCGASPTSPAASVPSREPLTLTAASPARGLPADRVVLAGAGFDGAIVVTFDGVAAKVRSLSNASATVIVPSHPSGPADIVVTISSGEKATLAGGFTYDQVSLTAAPAQVAPGERLTVSWQAPNGRGCNGGGDWIAIYKVGDPDSVSATNGHSDLWYTHTCGAVTGTSTLDAPAQEGVYEFRYMVDEVAAARSNPITVGGAASPSGTKPASQR